VQAGLNGVGLKAHGGGHGGHELVEGALGGCGEPAIPESAGLGHEQGLKFSVVEAGDFGAPVFLQLPTAGWTTVGNERNTRCTEGFHVAMRGALGDFEALCYFPGGETAVGLKEHKRGEEAVGFHGFVCSPFATTRVISLI